MLLIASAKIGAAVLSKSLRKIFVAPLVI